MNKILFVFPKKIIHLYFFSLILCVGCISKDVEKYTEALNPKLANNQEVIKAIKHYQKKGESQKLEALLFILKNMDNHYALSNILSKEYDSILSPKEFGGQMPTDDSKHGIALKRLIIMEEKYKDIKPRLTKIRYDINLLESKYLIENIDIAFQSWEKAPWAKDLSFVDFCENVLPYRADHEPIHYWRKTAYQNFEWVMEADAQIDRFKACSIINDSIKNVLSNMIEMNMYPIRLTYDNMYKFKLGICEDETVFALLSMRSVGLPVGIDFVPQWPWRSMGHSWNYLLLEDGSTVPFMGTETNPGEPHFEKDKKGKVYRKTFSKQEGVLAEIEKDHKSIPNFFRSPYFKDVTHLYAKTHNITLPLESSSTSLGKYVYLSVFDNQNWVPIDWSVRKENEAIFSNIEGGIVYLPKYYNNGHFVYTEQPVIIDKKGKVTQLIPDTNKTRKITLKRKYPLSKHMDDYLKNMVGGRFELSNHADFSETVTMGTIKDKPQTYLRSVKNKVSKAKYKYLRYVSSEKDSGRCNMAILKAYGLKGNREINLKGKVIGTEGSYKGYGAEKQMTFDNDPSTFFDASEEDWGKAWIGLEFDNPTQISRIEFMPRNDTNTIFEGQEYELFYWDKGWHGMGKKVADASEEITFEGVPVGALYLLHNHTGGTEERIFTLENEQVKWY
ncbi:hypothetical protein [Changchengzhania lutea]|uniref:hypothetical protein n=1 Tax=Changchengzhania lutea TaxID=2049305 RepID=UPI00115D06AB|nr:hypothetical protein [Changchengzhania lutea]